MIELKEEFVPRKEKIYSLFREGREEVTEFIWKQTRKRYIISSKSPQTVLVFFEERRMERRE